MNNIMELISQVEGESFRQLKSVPANLSPGQLIWHPDSEHVVGVAWNNEPWAELYPSSTNRPTMIFVANVKDDR